jgi:RNA 2',3'-cyclic 3'-phosphodiesterase
LGEDERARLFVALELPGTVRQALSSWGTKVAADVQGLRRVAAESLHVTLCFLGSLPVTAIPAVVQCCSAVAGMPGAELSVSEALWLPRRRPRVVGVALTDGGGRLALIQTTLSEALSAAGLYHPEVRPFLPHVTVLRVRSGARVRAVEVGAPSVPAFGAVQVVLMRSRISSAGASYERLHLETLSGDPGALSGDPGALSGGH